MKNIIIFIINITTLSNFSIQCQGTNAFFSDKKLTCQQTFLHQERIIIQKLLPYAVLFGYAQFCSEYVYRKSPGIHAIISIYLGVLTCNRIKKDAKFIESLLTNAAR